MKEFIEFIAKHLVDNPDSVVIDEKNPEENKVVLSLKVQADDVGKVIGKKGRNAQALRTILGAAAMKEHLTSLSENLKRSLAGDGS